MNLDIMNALVELVKQGGRYAIWGIAIYGVIQFLKLVVVSWVVWSTLRHLFNSLQNFLTLRFMANKDKVTLLGKEASSHLLVMVKDYQDTTSQAMRSLLEDVKNLSEKLNSSKKED